ncbi:MAG TPA: hypothetical protein VEI07_26570 [Planctomycetaceae bacterium]|nr:hypothetical protein [Planctomycetaceae bacterium]
MSIPGFFGGFGVVYAILIAIATFIVHTLFAFAVDRDARRCKRRGEELILAGPFLWALATFVGGPLVAVAYWLVHHSTLRDAGTRPSNNGGTTS